MEQAVLVALIAAVSASIIGPIVTALLNRAKRHNEHDENEADEIEKWRKKVDKTLDEESKRVDSVEDGIGVLCKGVLQIANHMLEGDHTDQLVEARDGLQNYLIKR